MSMSNNDNSIPVVQGETLLYLSDEQDNQVQVGTPAWYTWLSTARSFAFRSALGSFTARREPASNKRGGEYWRAYRKHEGRLHRVYLGKSEELTLDRLNSAAVTLASHQAAVEEEREQGRPVP